MRLTFVMLFCTKVHAYDLYYMCFSPASERAVKNVLRSGNTSHMTRCKCACIKASMGKSALACGPGKKQNDNNRI